MGIVIESDDDYRHALAEIRRLRDRHSPSDDPHSDASGRLADYEGAVARYAETMKGEDRQKGRPPHQDPTTGRDQTTR